MKQTYRPALSLYETQSAIDMIKQCFPRTSDPPASADPGHRSPVCGPHHRPER